MIKAFVFLFFYVPIAGLFIFFEPLGELGWGNYLVSVPLTVVMITIIAILERKK